tara:strand:- start:1474 stop:2019 length:546 start_codon:yes stop_codon:yes gene_type:complete
MQLIKTLYKFNYNFAQLPVDIMESVNIVLRTVGYNSKIEVLDTITFNSIRSTQPTDEIIEHLFELNRNTTTTQENNSFNSAAEIDEANDLFTDPEIAKNVKQYYIKQLPAGAIISELVFDRQKYTFIESLNWLERNDFDTEDLYPLITDSEIRIVLDQSTGSTNSTELTSSIYALTFQPNE